MNKKILAFLMFFLGLSILFYPYFAKYYNNLNQEEIISAYQMENKNIQLNEKMERFKQCNKIVTEKNGDFSDPFAIDFKGEIEENCADILGFDKVIAILKIPKLNLSEPVYYGTSLGILDVGVGLLEGSSLPIGGIGNHTVLAGHRGLPTREMFRNFHKLEVGDTFIIESVAGELTYKIIKIDVVMPNETDSLIISPDKDLVTLFTCTPFLIGTERLMIYGERYK